MRQDKMSDSKSGIANVMMRVFGVLLVTTLAIGGVMANFRANADNPASVNASVFVSSACTMSGGNNDYVDTMSNGESKVFGPSTIKAVCNDASGLAIYTVGYSGDTITGGDNDKMLARATGSSNNIVTATDDNPGSGSYWAMRITAVSGTYTPTIENSFDRTAYHIVPTAMTKVASLSSATDQGSTAEGSSINANYKVSIASAQPADTYTGKVKYVLVHPNTFVIGTYDVNFYANGGTGTLASQTNLANYEDQTLNPISSGSITPPAGYRFVGWCDATESTPSTPTNPQTTCPGNLYTDGDTIPASTVSATATRSNASTILNLYAVYGHYSEIPLINTNATTTGSTSTIITRGNNTPDTTITNPQRSYTISGLEANGVGGTGATVTFPQAGACTSTTNCTYNYIFSGWYTATSEGTKIINPDSTLTPSNGYTDNNGKWNSDDTPTLYSQWTENTDPTNTITLPTITKEGHTCGWATSNSTTTRTYESGQTLSPLTADTVLYGTCTANTYTQTIKYRYENTDGSFTNYTEVTTDVAYGNQYSWSTAQIPNFDSTTYQAASVPAYTVTGEKTTEVDIMRNIFTCKISYKYQNADGTYNNPTVAVNTTKRYGESCSWSTNEIPNFDNTTYQAANYTNDNITTNIDTTVNIDRNTVTCNKRYRLQNADGTWGDYTNDGSTTALYGGSCNYEKGITDYKNAADATNDTPASTSASNVTSTQTLSLDFYRNTYALTVNRNTTAISSTTGASSSVRWGQAANISASLATGYHFTTWSQTAGTTGSFGSATSTSTTFTMPKSAATIYADGAINTYTCKISYKLQNADSSYASPVVAVNETKNYGSSCSWSRAADATYQAASYTNSSITSDVDTTVNVNRNTVTCNKRYRLQNADGSWGSYTSDGSTTALYGGSCSYTKGITDYKNSASGTNDTPASTSASSVTSTQTLSLDFYRNTYALTVNRNTTAISAASGAGTYRWDQAASISATTNTGYSFSTWSQTAGTTGSFSSATSASTTFTMPKSAATIYADGAIKSNLSLKVSFDSNVQSVEVRYNSTAGTLMGTVTTSGNSVSGLMYNANYYLIPTYKSGYEFNSWSKDAGTVGTLSSTTAATPYYTIGDGSNGVTLSSKSSKIYMQNMTASQCVTGSPTTVYDNRDEEPYKVQRLADGKCWMLDNLRLDPANSTTLNNITASNTHASATTLNYFKNGGGTTSDQYPTAKINNVAWTSSSQNYYSIPMTVSSGTGWTKDTVTTSYGAGSGKIGVYYNYCAASAGSYCYGNGTSVGTSSGNATEDLCPAGWRMPTGNTSGEFEALYKAYSYNVSDFQTALSTPLSGYIYSGATFDRGKEGYWWSSTRFNNNNMYRLDVSASNVYSATNRNRVSGHSLRCIAQ